jgi:hypothetical protein
MEGQLLGNIGTGIIDDNPAASSLLAVAVAVAQSEDLFDHLLRVEAGQRPVLCAKVSCDLTTYCNKDDAVLPVTQEGRRM